MIQRERKTAPSNRIRELQAQIRRCERAAVSTQNSFSTGCRGIDALLPAGGLQPGNLLEWIGMGPASGAGTLSLLVAWQVRQQRGPFVLIDSRRHVSPLALSALGFDLAQVVTIHPESSQEKLWVCEQALRCPGVGVVWVELGQLSSTEFRRLQLAAEESAGFGFIVRPEKALPHPSWAEARLLVEPRISHKASPAFDIQVVYSRGKATRSQNIIQIDSQNGALYEVQPANQANTVPLVS